MFFNITMGWVSALFVQTVLINPVSAEPIKVMTHNVEGFVDKKNNDEMRGVENSGRRAFNYEVVREILLKIGLSKKINETNLARGLYRVTYKENHALFPVSRDEQREDKFKWVGPIFTYKFYLYDNKAKSGKPSNIRDVDKSASICTVKHSYQAMHIELFGFTNIINAKDYQTCLKLLEAGRVVYTSMSADDFEQLAVYISPKGIKNVTKTDIVLGKADSYIAFSKNVPNEIIANWQSALNELIASGQYEQLAKRYLYPKAVSAGPAGVNP